MPSKKQKMSKKPCPRGKIINPESGRCVSKTGKIGQKILKMSKKHTPSSKLSPKSHQNKSNQIDFPREKMTVFKGQWSEPHRVEGYWKNETFPELPLPKAHKNAWPGKKVFLTKLLAVQDHSGIEKIGYRGLSTSRIDNKSVGSHEYFDPKNMITWPSAVSGHYIGKYNVIPSKEFYEYIMNYRLN